MMTEHLDSSPLYWSGEYSLKSTLPHFQILNVCMLTHGHLQFVYVSQTQIVATSIYNIAVDKSYIVGVVCVVCLISLSSIKIHMVN